MRNLVLLTIVDASTPSSAVFFTFHLIEIFVSSLLDKQSSAVAMVFNFNPISVLSY